jgi:hypothetical protein
MSLEELWELGLQGRKVGGDGAGEGYGQEEWDWWMEVDVVHVFCRGC